MTITKRPCYVKLKSEPRAKVLTIVRMTIKRKEIKALLYLC